MHRRAERLHHQPAVRLLVVGRADLPDLALEAEQRAGEGQRRAPLAGAGLGGEPPDAGLGVVVRLRHRGVRLVRAGRRDAFVLVVDVRRGAERLLEPVRPVQRRRPPQPVDVEHLAGDVDVALRRDLLEDEVHREQRGEVVGAGRLQRAGVQGRRRRARQVGDDVVPLRRHLGLVQHDLGPRLGHVSLLRLRRPGAGRAGRGCQAAGRPVTGGPGRQGPTGAPGRQVRRERRSARRRRSASNTSRTIRSRSTGATSRKRTCGCSGGLCRTTATTAGAIWPPGSSNST